MNRYLLNMIAQETTEKNKRRMRTKRTMGPEWMTIWTISLLLEMGIRTIHLVH